jgi:hypothetical protein
LHIRSHAHPELKLHAAPTQDIHPPLDHFLVQFECRHTIQQQAAGAMLRFKNSYLVTELGQFIGTRQSARPGTDHRHPKSVRRRRRDQTATVRKGEFIDKLFDRSDTNWLSMSDENARALAKTLLRTDPRTNLRHVAGGLGKFRRFDKPPLCR